MRKEGERQEKVLTRRGKTRIEEKWNREPYDEGTARKNDQRADHNIHKYTYTIYICIDTYIYTYIYL